MITNNPNWHGLMTILEISYSVNGKIVWQDKNIKNMFHTQGEEWMLKSVFVGGPTDNNYIPDNYYFGMDNRATISTSDTMEDLIDEPSTNGYTRAIVNSTGNFNVSLFDGINRALGPIITFSASGGTWGPVKHLFLTDKSDGTGYLISTATLPNALTLESGSQISMRMGLSLRDCP